MTDDHLLRALGQLAREQRRAEPPADFVAPASDALKERIVGQGLAALGAHRPPTAETPAATPPAPKARARASVAWRWWLGLAAPAALAAGVALWVGTGGTPALPRYAMEVSGGAAEYRAAGEDPARPLVVEDGSVIEIRLRPETSARGPIAARAFWVKGTEVRAWKFVPAVSAEGAVRMRGPADRPFGAGEGELVTVVAAPGSVPTNVTAAALLSPPKTWQVFRRPVRWR